LADKDLAEKYLESFSDVFADIYNVLLFRKEILLEEGLEEGPTESIYKVEENNFRNQFRDTVKLYKNGLYKVASFGIENESRIDKICPSGLWGMIMPCIGCRLTVGKNENIRQLRLF